MPAPTNISAATAVELGPLPNSISQRVDDSGTTYTVWYKITNAVAGMIGPWAFGDLVVYLPTLHIYESDGVTPVVNNGLGAVANKRMQFPSVGSTYYLKIVPNGGNPSPANLTISALYFTQLDPTPVSGSILTGDDTWGMPATLMNAAGSLRKFLYGFANGESASILPSGRFVMTRDDETGVTNGLANIYNGDCSLRATFRINNDLGNSLLLLTGASDTYFYTLDTNLAPYPVQRVDSNGVILSNIWQISASVLGIAPSRDDSILYYTKSNLVKRWDLVNNVALADIYTLPAGYSHIFGCLYVLSDNTIIVAADHLAATVAHKVFRIDATGTLLNTYDLTYAGFTIDRIALNTNDSATSFWVWERNPSTGVSRYQEISTTGGGAVISTFDITEYEAGVYLGAATATPTADFGPPFSCPFLILQSTLGPSSTTYPVRRLRQTAHLNTQQLWTFFSKFQLDLETGVGLNAASTVQGFDPQVMLSYSDDGGHTWSPERWVSAGQMGQYKWRAIWWRLGRSRDRVWRIVVSDPVAWRLLAAYVDATPGIS